MSVTLQKTIATGSVSATDPRRDLHALQAQLTSDTGVKCLGVTQIVAYDPEIDPGNDSIALLFESTPNTTTVDATLAAFPKAAEPLSGSFAVAANTAYTIYGLPVEPGRHIAVRVQIHAALGDASSSLAIYADWRCAVWRNTTGSVVTADPNESISGRIPGFRIEVSSTADSFIVQVRCQRTGTLTLFSNRVEITSMGEL